MIALALLLAYHYGEPRCDTRRAMTAVATRRDAIP